MKADLRVTGPQASFGRYIASGGTAIQAGEPLHNVGALTSGVINTNEFVLAAADTPVIGTHRFGGVAIENSENAAAGTTNAQFLNTANPTPNVGRIWGRAETTGSVDTDSELRGLIGDAVLIDYSASGGSDGGQLYTIKEVASADTSALEIVGGNISTYQLAVVIDPRGYRNDVS